jgi:hypothetical protein
LLESSDRVPRLGAPEPHGRQRGKELSANLGRVRAMGRMFHRSAFALCAVRTTFVVATHAGYASRTGVQLFLAKVILTRTALAVQPLLAILAEVTSRRNARVVQPLLAKVISNLATSHIRAPAFAPS